MDYYPAFWIEGTRLQEIMSTKCQGPSKEVDRSFLSTGISEQHLLLISLCFKFLKIQFVSSL